MHFRIAQIFILRNGFMNTLKGIGKGGLKEGREGEGILKAKTTSAAGFFPPRGLGEMQGI